MKKIFNDLKGFAECKIYMVGLALTVLCAYGYAVTHHAIGMDDTVIPLYYEEGLAPYVGRWSLFVINKLFHISDFTPWMTELISVGILMISVTLWCVLWKRIIGGATLPQWQYVFVAAVFASCPLISEVFVFYLHNGVCLGYGVTALAVLCLLNSLTRDCTMGYRIKQMLGSALLFAFALGFYEAFAPVYIMGAILCFMLIRRLYAEREECTWHKTLLPWLVNGAAVVGVSLLIRAVVLQMLKWIYKWDQFTKYNVLYRSLFGDIFTTEGLLAMELKRFWVKYFINGLVYLPITVFVICMAVTVIWTLYHGLRKKDILLPICSAVLVAVPIVMILLEGLVTRYRSAQYVPLLCAFGILLVLMERSLKARRCRRPGKWAWCVYGLLGLLIFNQCADMNRWFYLDVLKYEKAKEVMAAVANDLEEKYDISKPVIFVTGYPVPYAISADAYVSYSSRAYYWICRLTNPVDPHLKEKYFSPIGFQFAESPTISILQWGVTAFDGTSQQMIEFWKMHGYDSFYCETDLDVIEEAKQIQREENMPAYPNEGYIKECEDYIIINLSNG